jgi:DnaJ-class molecular chaperone
MKKEACKQCDGAGRTKKVVEGEVVISKTNCSRCYGKGEEPGPSKGKPRFFTQKQTDEELSLEDQATAFLARRGFGRNGR